MLAIVAWGLLGPEKLATERRTRTLGLGATVRAFNDLAVPGLGGIWFGKQLLLAALGVAVARRVRDRGKRVRNIEVANAIEALGCWLALDSNGWQRDARLRGATKMRGTNDLAFANVRRPSFYVTQPMRQATVQPLRALGLVESIGERFNAFNPTDLGKDLIDAACRGCYPYKRTVLDHLCGWASSDHDDVKTSRQLAEALSPLQPMTNGARELLRERLVLGAGNHISRRRAALEWVEALRKGSDSQVSWNPKPQSLSEDHWQDLRAGALFFKTRDAAIALLDKIEAHIANESVQRLSLDKPLPETIVAKLQSLRQSAQLFLENGYDPSPGMEANRFCRECVEHIDVLLLERLLAREGRVLRQYGRDIVPGVAFRGRQLTEPELARSIEEEGTEENVSVTIPLPEGISHRVSNLFRLNLDLHGELGNWLNSTTDENDEGT